jgi:hypothetical protein
MRITDVFLALPQLVLALALAQLLTPSLESAMIALALMPSESHPLAYPAISPSGTPIAIATATTVTATSSAPRVPRITRESRSRPRLSVPKGKAPLGGFRRCSRCEATMSPG